MQCRAEISMQDGLAVQVVAEREPAVTLRGADCPGVGTLLKKQRATLFCSVLVLLLLGPAVASAQWEAPYDPTDASVPVGPAPMVLDSTCVVSVLNRTTKVNADGTWILPSVPANFGPVSARATCVRNGTTLFGQSNPFTLGSNQAVNLPAIILGNVSPIPTAISLTTPTTTFTQAGQTTQLSAMAAYPGGTSQDVSTGSGTQYQVSNPQIAIVSTSGVVTAVSSGTVVIQALNQGAQGIINIQVAISGASNGGIPYSWILANFCPNFSQGVPCPQLSDPVFASEDPDHDGLTNLQEFQIGTDPNNPDTDGDGLTDGQEVLIYHTNPLLFSTDGTGIPDGIEVATGTLGGTLAAKLAAALQSLSISPSNFVLTVNSLSSIASQQLTVTGLLIDGKTKLNLTSTQELTNYSSSNLTICNFGPPDGTVFAGNAGTCTITASNGGFNATASATVIGFSPTALGSVILPGFANEVAVNGNYAFVAAGSAGLQIVNVADPRNPVIAASLPLPGNSNSVRVVGNLVFMAGGSSGLQIVDVTNPLAPVLRSALNTSGNALDVNIQGNVAYVANGSGLFLANITNPSGPTALSSLPLTGLIRGVSVDPVHALAVVAADTNGVYVVDVSNLGAPVLRGQISTIDAHQVAIQGTYAFAADYDPVGTPYQNSMVSIDISNPVAPTVVSAITNKTFGGVLNDLALSGTLALGACVSFLPDGVPITDISSPTNLLSRAILSFPQSTDFGMGIAVDNSYVYLTTDSSSLDKFGSTGTSPRLYIGQYQVPQNIPIGAPPTAAIISPVSGATLVQGSTIVITVNATDNAPIAAVNLLVNGQPVLTDTVAPYVFYYTVPFGVSTLTLGATAIDYGNNVGTATNVVVSVIPDPGTTVTGRVVDGNNNPLPGFTAQTIGYSAATAADGTFSIAGVPTISTSATGITVQAFGVVAGAVQAGVSAATAPVPGGTTNVGNIVTVSRPLIVVDSNLGPVSAIDTSASPLNVIATLGAPGASPDGVSVTPDGSKAFVSIVGYGSPIRVFDLTRNPPAYVTDISDKGAIANTSSNVVTSDGRFVLSVWNQSVVTSINTATQQIISSLSFGSALSSIAVTPDSTTIIVADINNNVFRILALSPLGVLSDTGNTVPYTFNFWSPNIAMAPDGHFALLANPQGGFISILKINAQHNVTLSGTTIPISSWPWGIDFTLNGSKAYVTVPGSSSPAAGQGTIAVLAIDSSDNVTDTGVRIPIPNGLPFPPGGLNAPVSGIAIAVDGRAYISNSLNSNGQSSITIVDSKTDTVLGTVVVPQFPSGIGVPR
jgi:DNA-binding beta-propeller fold protein YncE